MRFLNNKEPKTLLTHGICAAIALFFLIFLIIAGENARLSYDASHNLLSYQSLFNGTGFSYTYNGWTVAFPTFITTGPELYLPAFFLWKIFGYVDYKAAIWVLIAYYMIFLVLLSWIIFNRPLDRLIAVSAFLLFFFVNRELFSSRLFIIPLGEIPATFFLFFGLYCLHKGRYFVAAILLGLSFDTKPNIIATLLPTIVMFWFIRCLVPTIKNWSQTNAKSIIRSLFIMPIFWLFLFSIPHLLYGTVLPHLVLDSKQQEVRLKSKQHFRRSVLKRGMGQLRLIVKKPSMSDPSFLDIQNFPKLIDAFSTKLKGLKQFYNNSYLALGLIFAAILIVLISSWDDLTFYLLSAGLFMTAWWILGATYTPYRYYLISELLFLLGIVIFIPKVFKRSKKMTLASVATIIFLIVSLSEFSPKIILDRTFNDQEKNDMLKMAKIVNDLEDEKIFTYKAQGGWNCPEIMFLSNRRFYSFQRIDKVGNHEDSSYFLRCAANAIHIEEFRRVTKGFELISQSGDNQLFKIK